MKSKFRPKIKKRSAPQTMYVDVYEHEKGWGRRLEEHFEFSSEEDASKYARTANSEFSKYGDSDCFVLAYAPNK